MTPEEHLHRARLALDEAELRDGSAGNLGPSRLFGQATAHALVGILEHLREVKSTVDGSGFGRSFDKEIYRGYDTPPET
jgi:hypothetical protein